MSYVSQLPSPVAPSAPRPPIAGVLTPEAAPQQGGIRGLLSQLGSNFTRQQGPEHAISTQLFSNAFTSGSDGRNVMSGIPAAAQERQLGIIRQQEAAAAEEERQLQASEMNKTAEWLKVNFPQYSALPPAQGFQMAMNDIQRQSAGQDPTAAMQEYQFAADQGYEGSFADWKNSGQGGAGGGSLGNTVYSGLDANGNIVPMQVGPDGFVQSQLPEGVTFAPGALNAERAAGNKYGGAAGVAAFDLTGAALMRDQTLAAIQDVRNESAGMDEQFGKGWFGIPTGQTLPAIPSTEKANFQVANERLTNRAFLEARQMLRGGGQITDFESRKAESAITNLESAAARGDKALYLQALADFEQAVQDGYAKIEAEAGNTQFGRNATGLGQGGDPSSGGGGIDALLTKYGQQ